MRRPGDAGDLLEPVAEAYGGLSLGRHELEELECRRCECGDLDLRISRQSRLAHLGSELEQSAEQPGKILSPDQLVQKVWGPQYASESDYVRRYIWYLRQKVEANPDEPQHIRNERNVGYYFAA